MVSQNKFDISKTMANTFIQINIMKKLLIASIFIFFGIATIADNYTTESAVFIFDTKKPEVTYVSPTGVDTLYYYQPIQVQWNATDEEPGENPVSVNIRLAINQEWMSVQSGLPNTGSEWVELPHQPAFSAQFQIVVEDAYGNSTSVQSEETFYILTEPPFDAEGADFEFDLVPPEVTLLSPDSAIFSYTDPLAVSWTSSDINLSANPVSIGLRESEQSWILKQSLPGSGNSYVDAVAVNSNNLKLFVSATDDFGNYAEDESNKFIIISGVPLFSGNSGDFILDWKAPEVSVLQPSCGEVYLSNQQVPISWTAGDEQLAVNPVSVLISTAFGGNYQTMATNLSNSGTVNMNLPPEDVYYARIKVNAVDIYGNVGSDEMDGYFQIIKATGQHALFIPQGWSGISSYITPNDATLDHLFAPVVNQLVILQNFDGIYWPATNTNTLVNWETESGYSVKMNSAQNIAINGYLNGNKTLGLSSGWSIIPVLSECPLPVSGIVSSGNLLLAKDIAGTGVYWPALNINTLGNVQPGKAYFVKFGSPGSLVFGNCEKSMANTPVQTIPISPWNSPVNNPVSHIFGFSDDALNPIQIGDVIGIFNQAGFCSGILEFSGSGMALTAFGDDHLTSEPDGFTTSESVTFRLYRSSENKSYLINPVYEFDAPNTGAFSPHGISIIKSLELSPISIDENIYSNVNIYPNPGKGIFNISGITGRFEISVTNSVGKIILQGQIGENQSLDLTHYPSGIYLVKIVQQGRTIQKKIVRN